MKKRILILMTLLFVFSCQEKQLIQKPANFISENEMTAILVDYYLAKGYNDIEKTNKRVQKSEDEAINPSAYIYKKHNIDSLQFAQNMNYYLTQEEIILAIFTDAQNQLKTLEKKYKAINKKEKVLNKKSISPKKPSKENLKIEKEIHTDTPKTKFSNKP
jgi:hypothetical protein